MINSYKIIKEYPGSQPLGTIVDDIQPDILEKFPEYFELIPSNRYFIFNPPKDALLNGFSFVRGRIYECIDPNNINKTFNFIDGNGNENGYNQFNSIYFTPVTEADFIRQREEDQLPLLKVSTVRHHYKQYLDNVSNHIEPPARFIEYLVSKIK